MKRPTTNNRTAESKTTTTTTTLSSGSATGDHNLTSGETRHRKPAKQFEASELSSNINNNNNDNIINLKTNITSTAASAAAAARLSLVDDRYQKHHDYLDSFDHIDQQQVSLLDLHYKSDREEEDPKQNSISQLNRQQVHQNNTKDRTTFFVSTNMFSSNANRNNNSNNGRTGADSVDGGGGDFSSNDNNSKKTKKNKVTILGSSGASLVAHDIESANSKTLGNDDDTTDGSLSSSSAGFCHGKLKWITLAIMALIIILVILLVLILSSTVTDDNCLIKNSQFQQTSGYKLFSTKTLYSIAFYYLSKTTAPAIPNAPTAASLVVSNYSPSSSSSNNINSNHILDQNTHININNNYDKSSVYVPDLFSRQDSLESLNKRLTSEFGCQAKRLYFVGRHAARLPSDSELVRINRHMKALQARIDPDSQKKTPSTPTTTISSIDMSDDGVARQQAVPNDRQPMIATGSNKSETVCDPLDSFKHWEPFAQPSQGNLLTETGAQETKEIAKRFKSIYPHLFNASETQIHVGTTEKIRTAQTAVNFIRHLDNYIIDGCKLNQFPVENTADEKRSIEINEHYCYKDFLSKYTLDKLMFHHTCELYVETNVTKDRQFKLNDISRTESIVNSVKLKLKLSKKDDELTNDETRAIYDVCKYETALTGRSSIWCSLFTKEELRFFEYMSDVDDFFNTAYGHDSMRRSACKVTYDVLKEFYKFRNGSSTANAAHFYFTHSQVIQKILAASVDLSEDPGYSLNTVLGHLSRGEAPKNRQFQTSLLTPFSANIAFTLYECPRTDLPSFGPSTSDSNGDGKSDGTPAEMNVVVDGKLKVVASLNEQPIRLTGCRDYVCDFNHLVYSARIADEKKCDLAKICSESISYS